MIATIRRTLAWAPYATRPPRELYRASHRDLPVVARWETVGAHRDIVRLPLDVGLDALDRMAAPTQERIPVWADYWHGYLYIGVLPGTGVAVAGSGSGVRVLSRGSVVLVPLELGPGMLHACWLSHPWWDPCLMDGQQLARALSAPALSLCPAA
jgi:hypothetical protein